MSRYRNRRNRAKRLIVGSYVCMAIAMTGALTALFCFQAASFVAHGGKLQIGWDILLAGISSSAFVGSGVFALVTACCAAIGVCTLATMADE